MPSFKLRVSLGYEKREFVDPFHSFVKWVVDDVSHRVCTISCNVGDRESGGVVSVNEEEVELTERKHTWYQVRDDNGIIIEWLTPPMICISI